MRLRLRIGTNDDLSNIYNLHLKCFSGGDVWYKSIMGQYIDNSLVVESCDTGKLLGCLFQGNITPANLNEVSTKVDDFEFIDSDFTNYIDLNKLYPAILLVCVDPDYRSKGIGRKLIQAHINSNKDKGLMNLKSTRH
jgi:ribosomal protein S18 acetylase RimI-like enzyme